MYGHASRSRRALRALVTSSLTAAFCGLVLAHSVLAQSFPTQYYVNDITPSLPYAQDQSAVYEIEGFNNHGEALLGYFDGSNEGTCLWNNGQVTPILPAPGSPVGSVVTGGGLNNSGQVTASVGIPFATSSAETGSNSALTDLGLNGNTISIPSYNEYATIINSWSGSINGDTIIGSAINDSGDIIGNASDGFQNYCFVYMPATGRLPFVFPQVFAFNDVGANATTARALNNNDIMVGTSGFIGGTMVHAVVGRYGAEQHDKLINGHYTFYWTFFANTYDLTPFAPHSTGASAINNNNQILVGDDPANSNTATSIYNFDASSNTVTSTIPLTSPFLPPSSIATYVQGNSINDAGISVGDALRSNYLSAALIYDTNGKGYDLNNYIPAQSLGISLSVASRINNSGQILAYGYGAQSGRREIYLLTPIVPQSLTISKPAVTGGNSVTGTVTLNYNANVKTVVHLSSSNTAAATVPATVTIAAGKNSAPFPITAHTVASATSVTIQASYANTNVQATLTVNPPSKVNTLLTVASLSGTRGQTVMLKATLKKASNGALLSNEPVSFMVNGTSIGPVPTNSGVAIASYLIPSTLSPGKYTIKASFAGDSAYNTSTGTGTLTVN
jgi:hypothetical protein